MIRRNPFKRHRVPREVILLAVLWCRRYPLLCRDVQDMLAGLCRKVSRSLVAVNMTALSVSW